jgi:hypothetical protein
MNVLPDPFSPASAHGAVTVHDQNTICKTPGTAIFKAIGSAIQKEEEYQEKRWVSWKVFVDTEGEEAGEV